MRKAFIFTILIVFLVLTVYVQEVRSEEGNNLQTIPDEAIRLRILANSDADEDQRIKNLVRDKVSNYITELVQEIDNIDVGRETIAGSIPELEKIIAKTLREEGINQAFTVEYDLNISFPLKIYDEYVYPAGEYEAILITIGAGQGSNWWCVLFPPLCFLDFSNGSTIDEVSFEEEAVVQADAVEEEVEVSFFLWEWLGF